MPSSKSPRFDDSVEATEFIDEIESMLNDPRLEEWAGATSSTSVTTLMSLQSDMSHFQDSLIEY